MWNGKSVGIVIVAGGNGQRMGADVPKQFLRVGGEVILVRTVRALMPFADTMVVVLPAEQQERWAELASEAGLTGEYIVCNGGSTRFESVRNGVATVGECDLVAIHDGVRPLVTAAMIERGLATAERCGSAIPTIGAVDSYRIERDGTLEVVDRSKLRAVQTPQIFDYEIAKRAYEQPWNERFTDDGTVVEGLGVSLGYYEGERRNLKITTREDLAIAEALLGM